jgi:hypothetical protein
MGAWRRGNVIVAPAARSSFVRISIDAEALDARLSEFDRKLPSMAGQSQAAKPGTLAAARLRKTS